MMKWSTLREQTLAFWANIKARIPNMGAAPMGTTSAPVEPPPPPTETPAPEPIVTEAPVDKVNLQLFGETITADVVKTFPKSHKRKPLDTTAAPLEELEVGQEVPPGEPCPVLEPLLLNESKGDQTANPVTITVEKAQSAEAPKPKKRGRKPKAPKPTE